MNIDSVVFAFAGTTIIVSLILAILHSPYWLLLAGFVGVNMLQSAFTGACPLAMILKKFGVQPGPAYS